MRAMQDQMVEAVTRVLLASSRSLLDLPSAPNVEQASTLHRQQRPWTFAQPVSPIITQPMTTAFAGPVRLTQGPRLRALRKQIASATRATQDPMAEHVQPVLLGNSRFLVGRQRAHSVRGERTRLRVAPPRTSAWNAYKISTPPMTTASVSLAHSIAILKQ